MTGSSIDKQSLAVANKLPPPLASQALATASGEKLAEANPTSKAFGVFFDQLESARMQHLNRSSAIKTRSSDFLSQLQERASKAWSLKGLPTRRLEDWKYTSLAKLERISNIQFAEAEVVCDNLDELAKQGVQFVRASELAEASVAGFEKLLALEALQAFGHLARSVELDPYVLIVPDDVKIETAIYLKLATPLAGRLTDNVAKNKDIAVGDLSPSLSESLAPDVRPCSLIAPVVYIISGAKSQFKIFQDFAIDRASSESSGKSLNQSQAQDLRQDSPNSQIFLPVTVLLLNEGSQVEHAIVASESSTQFHFQEVRAQVFGDADYKVSSFAFGGGCHRLDMKVELLSEGASARLDGLWIASEDHHIDFHTQIIHAKGETTSEQLCKGVLNQRSRGVFNGKVVIAPQAQKSSAAQLNKNLLLTRQAEIDTKPELEIFADDVKASHGATVAQLDPEHTFYLRSRGIDEASAQAILIKGFAMEIADRIVDDSLRNLLIERVSKAVEELI
jgi:Fe-S cluster assembly protein SufD